MKRYIKYFLPSVLLRFSISLIKQYNNIIKLAFDYGQWKSIRNFSSCDASSVPVPWYTYPATEYLQHLDLLQFKVHEFGSGNSTLWWSKQVKCITSVEDDEKWFNLIEGQLNAQYNNINYRFVKDRFAYASDFSKDTDIFIVDGSYRKECIEMILKQASFLMIIFDNSDWYPNTIKQIQNSINLVQIDFHGFGPINNYTWTTSIFLNPLRSQELKYRKTLRSIASLAQVSVED